MKYAQIYAVEKMCKVLKVSKSAYYNWLKNPTSQKQKEDKKLLAIIYEVYFKSKKTYRSPRISKELQMIGY